MSAFFDTDAGQLIAGAKKYLSAANILMETADFNERPSLLFAPILHLAAHGAELLLKYPLVASGLPMDAVRRKYGHDLMLLWDSPGNAAVKSLILQHAEIAWNTAKADPRWSDKFEGHPHHTFEEALQSIARLHGPKSDFALRYIVPPNTPAPRPWLLVQPLLAAADQGVRMPDTVLFPR